MSGLQITVESLVFKVLAFHLTIRETIFSGRIYKKFGESCCKYRIDIAQVVLNFLRTNLLRIIHQRGGAEIGKKGEFMGSISETRL